jgi:hypothetical protein
MKFEICFFKFLSTHARFIFSFLKNQIPSFPRNHARLSVRKNAIASTPTKEVLSAETSVLHYLPHKERAKLIKMIDQRRCCKYCFSTTREALKAHICLSTAHIIYAIILVGNESHIKSSYD